jgi:uncharacterized protein (DUF433 family)
MLIGAGLFVCAQEVDDADALVSADPEIMGGAPCFTGTRVPIDTVLASLDRGIGMAELRESFRLLTALIDECLSPALVGFAVAAAQADCIKIPWNNSHTHVKCKTMLSSL